MKRSFQQTQDDDGSTEKRTKLSKSRACTECKKHKIKCERKDGSTNCTRCSRLGHECVVNNSLQKFIEDDAVWKTKAMAQTLQLQAAISDLLRRNNLPDLSTYSEIGTQPANVQQSPNSTRSEAAPVVVTHMDMTRDNSPEPEVDEPELVSAPMRSLYEVTKLRNLRSNLNSESQPASNSLEDDFISRGEMPLVEAENLFAFFKKRMNQFLWGGIALVHDDLTSVRKASPLLATAIIVVASLHMPESQDTFNICYNEFTKLVSKSTLNRHHTLDEIRALAIGAFWLSDLSWQLSGHAVRVATEINLHQSVQKLLRGKRSYFKGAQIWYLLYVCDHHFSIAYGRPPVIHEDYSIKNYERFLESPQAGPGDLRLIAQVALFQILTRAYHAFGSDIEQPLSEADFSALRAFNIEVEQWRQLWQPRLGTFELQTLILNRSNETDIADSPYVGSYPSKGVVIHYHFAKFQLNSLSLRAVTANTNLSLDRMETANIAISSAVATLNMVLNEPDIRNAIVGMPLFTHTMIAFSAVFLLKVAWKWNVALLNIDAHQVHDLAQSIIDFMSNSTASERHLTFHIAAGLRKMLEKLKCLEGAATPQPDSIGHIFDMTIGPPQDLVYDNDDANGFGFGYSWSDFPMSFDFFPDQLPPLPGDG